MVKRFAIAVSVVLVFFGFASAPAFADEPVPEPAPESSSVTVVPAEEEPTTVPAEQSTAAVPFLFTVSASEAVSEKKFTVTVKGVDGQPLPANIPVIADWDTPWNGGHSRQVAVTDETGTATFTIGAWSDIKLAVTAPDGQVQKLNVVVSAAVRPISDPHGAPVQAKKYLVNNDPAAKGAGANPEIRPISKAQQKKMIGLSWRSGCVPMSSLREVHINYWGTDGLRHRGLIIANASVARNVASAFTDLYRIRYRIKSMHPVDVYGRNPRGPGANDYASMAAGNTSMFNCRYVVGRESSHVTSPHASGRALDVNPWHNPYVSRTGVYPNSWWLGRSTGDVTFLGNPELIQVFNRYGWSWGGSYGDYHHFDWRG